MANISKVSALFVARADQFSRVTDTVINKFQLIQRFATPAGLRFARMKFAPVIESLSGVLSKLGPLKALLAATLVLFGAKSIVEFGLNSAKAALETANLARQLGLTYQSIKSLEFGFIKSGASAEDAGNSVRKLNEKLAAAQFGDPAAVDVFNRLGFSIGKLNAMQPDKAFLAIVQALQKVQDPVVRAQFAFRIFGEQAGTVLQVVERGLSAFDNQDFGIGKQDIERFRSLGVQIQIVQQYIEMFGAKIASAVIPPLLAVIQLITDAGPRAELFGAIVENAGMLIASAIAIAYNTIVIFIFAWKTLAAVGAWAATTLYRVFSYFYQQILDTLNALGLMSDATYDATTAAIAYKQALLDTDFESAQQGLADLQDSLITLDELRKRMAQNEFRFKLDTNQLDQGIKAVNKLQKAFEGAESVIRDNRTPVEAFSDQITKLDEMLKVGAITWEVYARAVAKATNELEDQLQINQLSLPTAARRDSAEAANAVARARQEYNFKVSETPQQRLERLAKEGNTFQQRTAENTQKLAEAIKARRVVSIN